MSYSFNAHWFSNHSNVQVLTSKNFWVHIARKLDLPIDVRPRGQMSAIVSKKIKLKTKRNSRRTNEIKNRTMCAFPYWCVYEVNKNVRNESKRMSLTQHINMKTLTKFGSIFGTCWFNVILFGILWMWTKLTRRVGPILSSMKYVDAITQCIQCV